MQLLLGRGCMHALARYCWCSLRAHFTRVAPAVACALSHDAYHAALGLPQLEEESLQDNFVIAYELLDEVRGLHGC